MENREQSIIYGGIVCRTTLYLDDYKIEIE